MNELPKHLKEMASFTLATGLRQSNITELRWCDVDLDIDESKTGRAIPVPLNQDALDILIRQKAKHTVYVFIYGGRPVTRCNNHA